MMLFRCLRFLKLSITRLHAAKSTRKGAAAWALGRITG